MLQVTIFFFLFTGVVITLYVAFVKPQGDRMRRLESSDAEKQLREK